MSEHTTNTHGSVKSYIGGFILSLVLTFGAYIVTEIHINSVHEAIPHTVLMPTLLVFAMAQLFVQLYFFLHLGQEEKPRLNLLFFLNTVAVILIVVVGAVWIMNHLNHNMMPDQMEKYIIQGEGINPANMKDPDSMKATKPSTQSSITPSKGMHK